MTFDPRDLMSTNPQTRTFIQTANREYVRVDRSGPVTISPSLRLKNCLLIPSLSHKLLSISQLTRELNCTVLMTSSDCIVQDARTGKIIGHGTERDGLYYVDETTQKGHTSLAHRSYDHQLWTWHRRLGHPSLGYLKRLFPSFSNCNVPLDCEACVFAKSHKQSYYPSSNHSSEPFCLIHSDVWGPAPESNKQHFSYFISFIDDCTRMCWVYFLKHRSEVFDVVTKFYHMIVNQFNISPKVIRSNNGGEYINHQMTHFFSTHGIIHQTSCPHSPQQNGVAERKNRTLLEIARALMFEAHVPSHFWPEAIASATYLTNRLPSKSLRFKTPLDILQNHFNIPSTHSLPPRIFGCVVYVHLPKPVRHKLEPRVVKCIFVGYGVHQKGYRCFDPTQNKLYTTMDCDFFESSYFYPQHRPQGETICDDLSWLSYSVSDDLDPKEQAGNPTDAVTETIVIHSPHTIPVPSDASQGVELGSEPQEVLTNDDVPSATENSCRYELPPRRTRGVPPKRYDLEYESQRSRYPINQKLESNLVQTAKSFQASLYSSSIPRSTNEALLDPRANGNGK